MNYIAKKRIIISSYDDLKNPVYSGGGAVSVHEVAKRLAKNNSVIVLTGTYTNAKNQVIDSVRYVRTGSDMFGHKIGQLLFQLALVKHALSRSCDYWIESSTPPFTFSLLPLFVKKPVVSWVNMLCSFDMQRKYKLNFGNIERLLAKKYRYFIVPTGWVQKEILKMNSQALVAKIPHGYEHHAVLSNHQLKKYTGEYILFIGRIEVNQKGLDLLIKALSLTKSGITLVIAGSGSDSEERKMKLLVAKYDGNNRVVFAGRVKGQKKALLFKHATAVIIPSRYETFGIVALEAIGFQKPVICFNIPQLAWIPKQFAYKVMPFSTNSLAKAIDDVAKGKNLVFSKAMTQQFLKNFNWSSIFRELQHYLLQVRI